ncbi:Mor transcription activator family protein [Acinetobacter haemolyticus]|uniref:Mor transcription activator family protein n=1 Tax=Acinetobacter haemolyticus ATCC 19194 TaxID=707232 RepID=D4XJX8_ACIHA|nr:Mor transcription activator family protein [Acinetobacter haemolyticus]EFF84501.1 Mor transcription activator family protein [Acinetobacter haemolyticus ATCC 19194]ENW21769.1 hypothetical protein F926_01062 [Acinetobacter haemolyticus NIPH 261]
MSSNKQLGQHSKRGNALLLDLRDQAIILFKDANIDADKSSQIANELIYLVAQHWGGQLLYIVKADRFDADDRDIQIYRDFDGHNHAELAQKYDLSSAYIYRIVKRMFELEKARRQPDLFE